MDDELLGALKRVEKVQIVGNASIGEKTIKKLLKTGSGSFLGLRSQPLYRPDFLKADAATIQILYLRHGFLDASVSATADSGKKPGHVVVTYTIIERGRVLVRNVRVDSTSEFSAERIQGWIKTKPGRPFDPVQVPLDRETIAARYAERGHFPVIRTEVTRDSLAMDVRFVVAEGPVYKVDEIRISGVSQVDTNTVRRELLLHPGDVFERDRMVRSTERLYSTGLFNAAEVDPAGVDSAGGTVDLSVRVRERKKQWIAAGLGTGTQEKIRVTGDWGRRNLSGTGNALSANLKFGWYESDLYSARAVVGYTEPWLLGTRTRGTVAASAERGFELFSSKAYIQEALGLSFGASRELSGPKDRISVVFDNTWTRVAKVITEDPADTSTFTVAPYVRRVTASLDQDLRDNPLDARRGSLNNLTFQTSADVHGDQGRYVKTEASSGRHYPFRRGSSFAARLRVGRIGAWGGGHSDEDVRARVPVTDRYRTGGAAWVRGYPDNHIDANGDGGLLVIVTNFEYRFPILGIVGGTLFLDGGNVWERTTDFKWNQFFHPSGVDGSAEANDYRWAYGLGVRLRTPIGPIRIDYGRRFHPDERDVLEVSDPPMDEWHFSIGNMF
ncbi:MAG: BamA/OMP85 family outer membrane protein [Candidatus Eiseniibacteriota bacterium]